MEDNAMSVPQDPMPGRPFEKENGKWTFYAYPNGVQEEAGEYPDKDTAEQASIKVWRIWEANGFNYGPIGVIT